MDINDEIDMENLKYEVNKLKEENQELQVEIDILKEQLTITDVVKSFYCASKEHYPEMVGDGLCEKQCNRCRKMKQ